MHTHFPEIIDYEFTADMEDKLDSIENKDNTIYGILSGFWGKFSKELEKASEADAKVEVKLPAEESNIPCEKCGSMMVYKNGRFGKFLACPNYPTCRNTKAVDKNGAIVEKEEVKPELAGFPCEICGGEMVVRNGRFGTFFACINYPTCTFTKQKVTALAAPCPRCGSKLFARHGKSKTLFYSCEKYPECEFSSWDMPLDEKCPDCGEMLFYRKSRRTVICKNKKCGYKSEEERTVIE
jgi:DNA topoisomerase-1